MKTSEDGRAFITLIHKLCQAIRDCPVPVICKLEGYTLGGGLEVAAACDIRISTDTASFGMPEVKVGIPSVVEAALLPRLIGWGRTSWLLLTGENIDAAKAEAWGLVEIVVPAAKIDAAIEHCVQSIAQEATPLAVRADRRPPEGVGEGVGERGATLSRTRLGIAPIAPRPPSPPPPPPVAAPTLRLILVLQHDREQRGADRAADAHQDVERRRRARDPGRG